MSNFCTVAIYRSLVHCNFCLNLHIIHGDMKENVSVFFLNTVYRVNIYNSVYLKSQLGHADACTESIGEKEKRQNWAV